MIRTLREIYRADARPVGLLLSLLITIQGLVFLAPGDTFSVSILYRPMYYYFSDRAVAEMVWGWAYLITGLISIFCVFGSRNRIAHHLILPSIFLFMFAAIAFGRVSLYAVGPWWHGLFVIFMTWRYIRRSQDIL